MRSHDVARWTARFLLAGGCCALLAGCGAKLYEQRLGKTAIMFRHLDLLNDNLASAWGDPGGIELRVPLAFSMIPAPPPEDPEAEGGEKEAGADKEKGGGKPGGKGGGKSEAMDERQPSFMNVELPGLRAAFRTEVAGSGDEKAEPQKAFLYVLSNLSLAPDPKKDGETPRRFRGEKFHEDVVKLLSEALNAKIQPDPDPEKWISQEFPAGNEPYVDRVKYTPLIIEPEQTFGDGKKVFSLYLFQQGEIQVLLMFVLPDSVDMNLKRQVDLCLETLRVRGDKLTPVGAPTGPQGASGPSL